MTFKKILPTVLISLSTDPDANWLPLGLKHTENILLAGMSDKGAVARPGRKGPYLDALMI
jgi:hypothetical protein